jgi:calcineurin-like phosphoesterase family protein
MKFDERPFKDLNHLHESLISNFNRYVPTHGITYFLGDMGFKGSETLRKIIDRLHGTKVLVRGNHDGKMDSMYNAGFDVVIEKAQITLGKDIVTMSHCPLYGVFRENTEGMRGCDGTENWHKEHKHKDTYSFPDFGQYHLHGHIHSRKGNGKLRTDGRQMDVGVPAWNYRPVSLSDVQAWIHQHKKDNGLL